MQTSLETSKMDQIFTSESGLNLSLHARRRMEQRGITAEDLDLVFQSGREVYNGGALFVFMRRKDLPASVPASQKERLEGLTIVVSLDSGEIITTYKNRDGLRPILKKRKARRHRAHYSNQLAA